MGRQPCQDDQVTGEKVKVNFIALYNQYLCIKDEIDTAIKDVIAASAFSSGPFVKSFEKNFAAAQGTKYCVGVNSGTSALHIALWALGIGQGDEVIVPANTFFATPEAVSLTGATPRFVDCEPDYYNLDPDKLEPAVNGKTRAIIAVNLYGQPAQLERIKAVAEKHDLLLIEDCAQSHLADYKGKMTGTYGICGCFSFYPGKNLGAFGEGGAVTTDDEVLYNRMMALRDHGSCKKYYHDYIGHNYRMEGIQGAVLDVKLRHLQEWTENRRRNAALFRKSLADVGDVLLPVEMPGSKHVYHLFVIRTARRDELMEYLKGNEIYTGIHYPIPCHLQKAYGFLNYRKGNFPVSERYADEILSLPMYAELREPEIIYVSEKIREFYRT